MDNGKKKREWVKNFAIIFLAVLLVLTFFSNTIMNYSLPEVSAQYCSSGTITNKVRGSGVVETDDPYKVVFNQSRNIESVEVKVGSEVEKGTVLYVLEAGESAELKEAEKLLETYKNDYDMAIIKGGISGSISSSVENNNIPSIAANQARLENAKKKVEKAQKLVDDLKKQEKDAGLLTGKTESDLQFAEDDINAIKDAWTTQDEINQSNLQDALTQLSTAEKNVATCQANIRSIESQIAYATVDDISASDPVNQERLEALLNDLNAKLTKARADLGYAESVQSSCQTNYNNAVNACNTSAAKIKECNDQLANIDASSTQNDKNKAEQTYDFSIRKSNAEEALAIAQENLDKLVQELTDTYGLSDKLKLITDQQKVVDELRAKEGGDSIVAPVTGTVLSLNYVAGESIEKGSEVAQIQKAGKGFTLKMPVTSEQARLVSVGDEAEVANSWWYSDIHAKLIQIRPDPSNPGGGKLLVFEMEGDLTNGQSLSLTLGNRTANYDVIVPNSAIHEDNQGQFIYRIDSKSTPLGNRYIATRVDIKILARDDNFSAISGDLSGWEYVVTNSSKPVEDGKQVRLKD